MSMDAVDDDDAVDDEDVHMVCTQQPHIPTNNQPP